MLHPSYTDLMRVVNSNVEIGEEPVVNSRYSIVIATAKRARQLIDGKKAMVPNADGKKPFSVAVDELHKGCIQILPEGYEPPQMKAEEMEAEEVLADVTAEETVSENVENEELLQTEEAETDTE